MRLTGFKLEILCKKLPFCFSALAFLLISGVSLPSYASEEFEESLIKAMATSATTTLGIALSGAPEVAVGSVSTTLVILFQDYVEESTDGTVESFEESSSNSKAKQSLVWMQKPAAKAFLSGRETSLALEEFFLDFREFVAFKNPAVISEFFDEKVAALILIY